MGKKVSTLFRYLHLNHSLPLFLKKKTVIVQAVRGCLLTSQDTVSVFFTNRGTACYMLMLYGHSAVVMASQNTGSACFLDELGSWTTQYPVSRGVHISTKSNRRRIPPPRNDRIMDPVLHISHFLDASLSWGQLRLSRRPNQRHWWQEIWEQGNTNVWL